MKRISVYHSVLLTVWVLLIIAVAARIAGDNWLTGAAVALAFGLQLGYYAKRELVHAADRMSHLVVRMTTLDEIERTGVQDQANVVDGAASVLVDGELIGITNEYGTCVYVADGVRHDVVEHVAEHAMTIIAERPRRVL